MEEGQLLTGANLDHPLALADTLGRGLRFGRLGRQFGEELAGGDTHAAAQFQLAEHFVAKVLGDLGCLTQELQGTGDIEEGFVEGEGFDERGDRAEDLVNLRAHLGVESMIAGEEHRLGADSPGGAAGHRRVDPIPSGLVGRSGDDASRTGTTHDHRFASQLRAATKLDADEVGIHVDVEDRALLRLHSTRSTRPLPRSAPCNTNL